VRIAKPQFAAAHFAWFAVWIALNTGLFAVTQIFDEYPFFGLVTILALEAIFICERGDIKPWYDGAKS
jgi:uncharacterized membrane protein